MGLLDTTNKEYYQGNTFGNYQFTSLDDIITQFQIAYVGEGKIIQKVKRADIAFHAQRGLQEFSFDTFKSIKSQQIDLPPTLVMPLPHDYVNYTKLSWADSAGIKHPLYPTNRTSNPFQILQQDDGFYSFPEEAEEVVNGSFDDNNLHWNTSADANMQGDTIASVFNSSGTLAFKHKTRSSHGATNWGHVIYAYQELDVSDKLFVDLSADGTAVDMTNGTGTIRVGLTTQLPDSNTKNIPSPSVYQSNNVFPSLYDIPTVDDEVGYIEWTTPNNTTSKEILNIDVSQYSTIYVVVVSFHNFTAAETVLTTTNFVDNISVTNTLANTALSQPLDNQENSSTWNNYKSATPSENQDDYQDDTYWKMNGNRYGLDPQHAQANGSFYIDPRLGRIHFSSNISGKTVILDYVSDSLGTDAEMQVHKFAEEAMYKYIAYAILSTSSQPIHQQLAPRYKKERFAETRKAKLRLSNIKLEELTQILRGKSKQIKH